MDNWKLIQQIKWTKVFQFERVQIKTTYGLGNKSFSIELATREEKEMTGNFKGWNFSINQDVVEKQWEIEQKGLKAVRRTSQNKIPQSNSWRRNMEME